MPSSTQFEVTPCDETSIKKMRELLADKAGFSRVVDALARVNRLEYSYYYQKYQEVFVYSKTATSPVQVQTLKKMMKSISKDFIYDEAPFKIPIQQDTLEEFEQKMADPSKVSAPLLAGITREVLEMIYDEAYRTYLELNEFKLCS